MRRTCTSLSAAAIIVILAGAAVSAGALQVSGIAGMAARGDLAGCAASIQRGENVDAVSPGDNLRRTPLMLAAKNGNAAVASFLLEHGAEVNARDLHRTTAIYYAAEAGYPDIVELLVDHGSQLNPHIRFGDTPLIAATRENHMEVVQILLAAGADPSIRARDTSETPAALAHRLGHISIEQLLTRVASGGCFYPAPIPDDSSTSVGSYTTDMLMWPVPLKRNEP
jgi:hypothetical protein